MTVRQIINLIGIGSPFLIAAFIVFDPGMLFIALLSTMVTGFIQVSIGLSLLIDHYKNKHLQTYFLFCILFFSLCYTTDWWWIWAMPPVLAIYMTIILHFIILEEE